MSDCPAAKTSRAKRSRFPNCPEPDQTTGGAEWQVQSTPNAMSGSARAGRGHRASQAARRAYRVAAGRVAALNSAPGFREPGTGHDIPRTEWFRSADS
jgi:hypothetical protein